VQRANRPADARAAYTILLDCYEDGAGAEALLRAFLAERDCDRPRARFWIEVYRLIIGQNCGVD
jgi:hypothetical protein